MDEIAKNRIKVLITGVSGFMGSHLAEHCLEMGGIDIYGTVMSHHLGDELSRIKHLDGKIKLFECDLKNRIAVSRVLETVKPDKIFHLAAQSFVPTSWESPEDTLNNNIISELNIFEICREIGINPVIQIAGSSEEYGLVLKDEVPIKETNPLRPLSPYAVSKIAQDMLAQQYYRSYGTKAVITRCFNTEGPRRGRLFVMSSFAYQIAAIENGSGEPVIKVGNLEAYRDFTDVRDTVRALWLATDKCKFGEPYNIGSGKTHKIEDVLKQLLALSKVKIKIEEDPKLMRPSDVPILWCDGSKFNEATGWVPKIDFNETVSDTLGYWRNQLNNPGI
jgi:GDP-4-dehydro-6-deoxy-D-mannose reductase